MKNNNPAFTLTGRTKIFLFVCLGAMAVIDFAAFVYLTATGASVSFWIFPLLFLIADAIFILQTVFSNFRFKYTIGEIVFYVIMTFAVLILTVSRQLTGTVSVFTAAAGTGWCLIHVLSIVAALVCYLFTAKRFRSNVVLQALISIIASIACVMTAFAYVVLIADFGFFGQGSAVRPLAYEYDEVTDSYTVSGVLEGNGENVVIPNEFNGKPVTGVSAAVFASEGIKTVTLECSVDVKFTEVNNYRMNDGLKIYADREKIDEFKSVFCEMTSRSDYDLANSLVPCGLEDDEVFVTFDCNVSTYSIVKGEMLPTWIGKKGAKLDMSYFKDISYAAHNDSASDEDLYWNFENNYKLILSSIYAGESGNLIGKEITSDVVGAQLGFENIYRVYPSAGNDTKYDIADDFGFSVVNGQKLDYKLTVADNAEIIINSISREGFTLEWMHSENSYNSPKEMTSLKQALKNLSSDGSDLYVYPKWELIAPDVTLTKNKDSVEYGGDITLSATVIPAIEGMEVIYNWREEEDGYTYGWDKDYEITNIAYGETGYTLVITVQGDNTSLISVVTQTIPVTVTKRPLTVNWTIPDKTVYDGVQKVVTCGISGGIINNDEVNLSKTQFSHRDAGTYVDEVLLLGADSEKYSISAGQTNTFTIEKANLTVNWLTTETVYNGEVQRPVVSLVGVYNDEVEYNVTGYKDANVSNSKYTVWFNATKGGENYNIINGSSSYLIKPYPLSVIWQSDCEDTFTYDGKQHLIFATAKGENDRPIVLSTDITSLKNAGVYEITAFSIDANYEITSNSTKTYTVEKYGLTVEWGNTQLTYNGRQQAPTYTMKGVEVDGNILGGVSGLKKDVGNDYLCEVWTITEQYDHEKNYFIENNIQVTFSIVPAEVAVQWTQASYYYYNGKEQAPTAKIAGLGNDPTSLICTVKGGVDAGLHTAYATLEDEQLAKNYTLTDDSRSFTIGVAFIEVVPLSHFITFGSAIPIDSDSYSYSQLVEGDTFDEIVTNVTLSIEDASYLYGHIVPGEYEITVEVTKGEKAKNYAILCKTGTLIVGKRDITITIDDKKMTLGGELPEFTYKVAGLVSGDETQNVIKSFKLYEGEITGAGEYHIMVDEYADIINDLYLPSVYHGKLTVKAEVQDEV